MAPKWPTIFQKDTCRWLRNGPAFCRETLADGLELAQALFSVTPADGLEMAQHFIGRHLPMALKWPGILLGDTCRCSRNGPVFYLMTHTDGLEMAQHFSGDTCRCP